MADADSKFQIHVQTDYSGAGAKEAITDQTKLAEVTEHSAQAGAASGGGVGGGDAVAQRISQRQAVFDKYAASVASADAAEISDASKKAIAQEQQMIVATRRAQIEAAIAGDPRELAKLRAELAVRQLTLQTLRSEAMTQEELNAFIAEQNVLIEQGAAAAAARAAAEEAQAGGERLHGRAGHLGHLAENFGLDSNSAIAMGMGVMFGMEFKRLIEDQTKELNKQAAEQEKQGNELRNQIHAHHEELEAARSLSDVARVRTRIEEEINAAQEKRFMAEGPEREQIDTRINALQNELRIAANWPASALERRTAEEQLKTTLEEEAKILHEQLETSREARKITDEEVRQKNELLKIAAQVKLADIESQEKSGAISHEEAAKQRGAVNTEEANAAARNTDEGLASNRASLEADSNKLLAEQAKAAGRVAELKKKAEESQAAIAAGQTAQTVVETDSDGMGEFRKDAEEKRRYARMMASNASGTGNKDAAEAANKKAEEAEAKVNSVAAARAAAPNAKQMEELKKENESLLKQLEGAETAAQKAREEAEKQIPGNESKISDIDRARRFNKERQAAESQLSERKTMGAVTEGGSKDQQEKTRAADEAQRAADRKAKADEAFGKDFDKNLAPIAGGLTRDIAAATSGKPVGDMRQAQELVEALNKQFAANPKDTATMDKLVAALTELSGHFFANKAADTKLVAKVAELERATAALKQKTHDSY